jgi:histidinol-phosphatase
MKIYYNKRLEFLQLCADKADEIALKYFRKANYEVSVKNDNSPVSQADLEIEKAIRELVKKECPEVEIYGEEFGQCPESAPIKLIIDPIDGTRNFVRGLPIFASLLAIEEDGEIIAGVVSAPATKERWWAAKGSGSFYNGQKIQVSNISKIEEAQAFHGSLFGSEAEELPKNFLEILKPTYRQRGVGDYLSHIYVAMGCGEFALDFGFKPWDMAPLKIIVEEAGGIFTDAKGEKSVYSGSVITSNGLLHESLLKTLSK